MIYPGILTVFDMLVFFTNLRISGKIFGLISSFLSNRWLQVVLGGKSLQDHLVNAWDLQGSSVGLAFFLLYINDLPDNVICNIAVYADDTSLYKKPLSAPVHCVLQIRFKFKSQF